jgi:hypothetical protein
VPVRQKRVSKDELPFALPVVGGPLSRSSGKSAPRAACAEVSCILDLQAFAAAAEVRTTAELSAAGGHHEPAWVLKVPARVLHSHF